MAKGAACTGTAASELITEPDSVVQHHCGVKDWERHYGECRGSVSGKGEKRCSRRHGDDA